MLDRHNPLYSLVSKGLIDSTLGAVLSNDKEEGKIIGRLLEAAISATKKANEEARKTNVPVYFEENGKVFAIDSIGNKKFIKNLEKPSKQFPIQFKLT